MVPALEYLLLGYATPCTPLGLEFCAAVEQRAQALLQHHDGVTGTSKQHVAEDYAQRLDSARVRVEAAVSSALSRMAFGGGGSGDGREEREEGGLEELPKLEMCRLANVSTCDVTMEVRAACFCFFLFGVYSILEVFPREREMGRGGGER